MNRIRGRSSVLEIVLYVSVFFAYITPVKWGPDTQPWALLVSMLVVFVYLSKGAYVKTKYFKYWVVLFCTMLSIWIASFILKGGITETVSSLANYLTVLFVPYATYIVLKKNGGVSELLVKIGMNIWLLIGLMQKFVSSNFAYSMLSHTRTDETRGVISLAPEPSYYGFVCLFFFLIALEFNKHKLLYLANAIFQILFLAESSITVLYFACLVGIYVTVSLVMLRKKEFGIALLTFLAACVGYFIVLPQLHIDGRLGELLWIARNDPLQIIMDQSFQERLADITFSIKGFWDNIGLPHGFSRRRIMSGYGALLYEWGILGAVIIIAQMVIVYKGYSIKKEGVVISIWLVVILFSAIQLSTPMLSFYIGIAFYKAMNLQENDCEKSVINLA